MNTNPGSETGGTSAAAPPPPPPRPPRRPPWRFVRRERGRVLAGVTTGMAKAFHIDVMVVRVIWVIVTVASAGLGVAAYAICWVAFPSDENPAPITQIHHLRHRSSGQIIGVLLLAIGGVVVLGEVLSMRPFEHFGALAWATVLIGGGLAVLFLHHPGDDENAPTPPWASTATDTPEPATAESGDATPTDETPDNADTAPVPPTIGGPLPPLPPTSSAWTQSAPWPTAPPPRPRRVRHRSFLTPITISLLLMGAGVAALLDSTNAVHFTAAGVLASGLLFVGLMMIASTWFGRAHGLIPIGVILLLATIPAVSIDVPISGGIGERRYQPTTRAELQRHYNLGIGRLELDLKDAPLSRRVTTISGSLGIGDLEVNVPANVRVDVRAHVGAGATDLFNSPFDSPEGGWPQNTHVVGGLNQRGVLHLDLRVGAGVIRVHRWAADGAPLPA